MSEIREGNQEELTKAAKEVAEAIREAMPAPVIGSAVRRDDTPAFDGTAALQAWIRAQIGMALSPDEVALLGEGIKAPKVALVPRANITRPSQGAHLIPTTIAERVVNELGTYSAVYRVAQVIRTESMENYKIPVFDDTGNAAELVAGTTTSTEPAVSSVTLGCYTLTSKPVVVNTTVLRDSPVNLENLLSGILADRIGRKANEYFTTGTGSSQPRGLLASSGGVPTMVTTASASAITFGEVLELYYSIDQPLREKSVWMAHPTTVLHLRKLNDDIKRPLLIENPVTGMPSTIFGRPVVENPNMPTIAAGAKVLIFGDFSRYVIREVPGIRLAVLKERYVEYDSVGLIAFYDFDGSPVLTSNTKAIGCLAMKVT